MKTEILKISIFIDFSKKKTRKNDFFKNQNFGFFETFFENIFQKTELSFFDNKKFSAVTFEKINIFLQIQKHMKRLVRGFHFRY